MIFLPPALPSLGGWGSGDHKECLRGLIKGRVSPTESAGTFAPAGKGARAHGYNWPALPVSGGYLSDQNTIDRTPVGPTPSGFLSAPLSSSQLRPGVRRYRAPVAKPLH